MGKLTGAKIKEARTGAKMTQEQLAKQLDGLTASDISKAERGEKELTQAVLKQIAKLTGVTQASLLNAEKAADKPAAGKTPAKSAEKAKSSEKTEKAGEMKLTAAEKTLVELYRKADAETKKSVVSMLKGERNEVQQLLTSFFGKEMEKFLK